MNPSELHPDGQSSEIGGEKVLKVDVVQTVAGGTQTVAGTVTANQGTAGSASWLIIPSGTSNTSQTFAAISVGTSATALPSSALSGRRTITITNAHATLMLYIGRTSSTTAGPTGLYEFALAPEEGRTIWADGSVTWYGIRASSSGNANVTEAK